MGIDFDRIEKFTGLHFDNIEQLYFYVLHDIEVLKANNKNYNKKQSYIINDLFDIITSVKLED